MGWLASTGGGGKIAVYFQGTKITPDVRGIDFIGPGVASVTKVGGKITVNIVGGGGTGGGGTAAAGTNFFYQESPPTAIDGVTIGSRWMDSENGQEYIYINDGNSEQWVQPSIPNMISSTVNTVVGITGASYSATQLDYYIGISYNGPSTVVMPSDPEAGREIIVKDEAGHSGNWNKRITVVGADGELIDNKTSAVININNAALHFIYRNGWRIV